MSSAIDFLVDRSDFSKVNINSIDVPDIDDLKRGQLLLKIDRFALTANNITYAVMGDAMQYWKFFPKKENWGSIPVWGFAEVLGSKCDDITVGERLYGFFPMSTHLIVEPQQLSAGSFVDGTEHRQSLPSIYNQYIRTARDGIYTVDTEALQMLLRPLFTTAFLLDDFFNDQNFFDSNTIVLTSASSKTALGMAFLLRHNRKQRSHEYEIVGLTSTGNLEFVEMLGCYDTVLTYDQIDTLDAAQVTSTVDFAGNGDILRRLHTHLNDNLRYSCLVGASHWDQLGGIPNDLAGPQPQLFFAPAQAEKRLKEWGTAEFKMQIYQQWSPFIKFVQGWIQVEEGFADEAVRGVYQDVLAGKFSPSKGYILSLWNQ